MMGPPPSDKFLQLVLEVDPGLVTVLGAELLHGFDVLDLLDDHVLPLVVNLALGVGLPGLADPLLFLLEVMAKLGGEVPHALAALALPLDLGHIIDLSGRDVSGVGRLAVGRLRELALLKGTHSWSVRFTLGRWLGGTTTQ